MHHHDAEASILDAHAAALRQLPFDDETDFAAADRGFLGTLDDPVIRDDAGGIVWDAGAYDFVQGDAPSTVHPSLWRQSKLVARHGLFEVVEGIYQVRGFDLSVVSFIEGRTGVIVVDPLLVAETARAAWELYRRHRGDRPVVAVIHTHSHVDHFGGVLGIVSQEQVDAGEVQVIAPEGYLEHAVSENVYAGTAMSRRSGYMYGAALERGPHGQVGAGLGQTTARGQIGIVVPTILVGETGETLTLDGVEFEFQMAPGTEAPAEMHFHLPQFRALCMAENATHTLHNLITLRGALIRDPHVWSQYLTEAIERYGDRTDVLFASHHWPTWGQDEVREFLSVQRDVYAYLHDQTLRLLNKGMNGAEIAEAIELPPALENSWSTRGYYGSVSHNVKGIYQRYMGWFDGNPARLWPHPPQALATRYVEAIGGAARVVELARQAYEAGDLRWAATLLDHAVFADPDDAAARELLAATFEQLAYGAENGPWRNFFLSGAKELRDGGFGTPVSANAGAVMAQLTPEQLLDAIAITVDGPRAWHLDLAFDITFTELGRSLHVTLRNGVLIYVERRPSPESPLHVRLTVRRFLGLVRGDTASPGVVMDGDGSILSTLVGVLDPGDPDFDIVLP
ncbi:MBL fold metallo-hydrolase [Microbacterium sp. NEAU-LLC]|uniref:MBL fold metallo-hydrolase n=1 Tax=Microbacterium helvum TaxID=2773713 RepID=A0ABR8NS23_9MICO|nr:alkyl sulfatase dimerization domain-containing protein [Microbacterium helvum]MBD3942959.1 MBL fold metallo-hydrolase [Microbacterium helvum]